MKTMTYLQLKNQLASLTDEQLAQTVCYWGIDHSVAIYGDCTVTVIPIPFEHYQKGQVVMMLQEEENQSWEDDKAADWLTEEDFDQD